MAEPGPHRCSDLCQCPIHQEPLLYWPAGDDHACRRPDCEYAEGFKSTSKETTIDGSRMSRALLDTQALLMLRYHPDVRNLGR